MADKAELRTYALGIGMRDCYRMIVRGGETIRQITGVKGFVGVHVKERVEIFLYLTPEARKQAYLILKDAGVKGFLIKQAAFVPMDAFFDKVKGNEDQH